MKKDLTLLVLAAGMGSRFGGLKQIEPVGPNGEFIIDYSINDAIYAGFTKVVFVIKEENYEVFKNTIGKRIEDKIKVLYAFQKNSDVPEGIKIPSERIKPLGTAHAIYVARDLIKERFAMINADDFYGRDAYLKAASFLNSCQDHEYANIAYEIENTLTVNGAVKRGIIFEQNGKIAKIVESSVEKVNNEIVASPLNGDKSFVIPSNQLVSMNLFCFTPELFNYLIKTAKSFFQKADLLKDEWLIPDVATASATSLGEQINVIRTTSRHYGMTYREDLDTLKKGIYAEIEKGTYKDNLWS